MHFIFFDNDSHIKLLPLTYTRPAADLRIGILKISEKWDAMTNWDAAGYITADYLQRKFKKYASAKLYIAGNVIPNKVLIEEIENLKIGQKLVAFGTCLAFRPDNDLKTISELETEISELEIIESTSNAIIIDSPLAIFKNNGAEISRDIESLQLKQTNSHSENNVLLGDDFFIDVSAKVEGVTLNSKNGPIYIGKDAEIMEGSVIRGPFAALDHSTVKMSAKIYGDTTIGPHCKVGGEVSNTVFYGYSNKGHDGFLGNSVIGEWCNLGADTNSSNLKNNYSSVSVWDYSSESSVNTGETFCGVIMGDHSKTGINTMLNTGTVIGVSANIYGGDFPPKFIPSFSWGGANGFQTFKLDKAEEVAERMMARRNIELSKEDESILENAFEADKKYRS